MNCTCGHGRHNHVGNTGGCGLCECVYFREAAPSDAASEREALDVGCAHVAGCGCRQGAVSVSREQVREAGKRALDAYERIPYDNDLIAGEVWDILGRAALGIEVTD